MRQLANWFHRKKLESGLDRELQYHLERRIMDLERSGLPTDEARRQAMLELGGVAQIQEEVRDIWLTRWLRDFAYDLRFSARSFRRTPAFTITAVLSLMLGIGASTAIYSLVDQVLLHALPVRQPERLVLIDWKGDQVTDDGFGSRNLMSYPICRDLDQQKQFFEGVFCRALTPVSLSTGGDYHAATAEIISGNYFPVLGVGAALGQVLSEDDSRRPNANPVAVLSYDFWKTQLGGARDVVGRKVLVNRHPLTVIGVAASSFRGIDVGEVPSLWIPASMSAQAIPGFNGLLDRRTVWMQVLGRLRQDVTLREAEAGLQPWFKAILKEDTHRAGFPTVTAERRRRFLNSSIVLTAASKGHSELRRRLLEPLWVLFAVTAVLLGLACLNVSGLFLARFGARSRDSNETGARRFSRAAEPAASRGQPADRAHRGPAGDSGIAACSPHSDFPSSGEQRRDGSARERGPPPVALRVRREYDGGSSKRYCTGVAVRSALAGIGARPKRRHAIRRSPIAEDYRNRTDCPHFGACRGSGAVCEDSRRVNGEGAGLRHDEARLIRDRLPAKRVLQRGGKPADSPHR